MNWRHEGYKLAFDLISQCMILFLSWINISLSEFVMAHSFSLPQRECPKSSYCIKVTPLCQHACAFHNLKINLMRLKFEGDDDYKAVK